MRSLLDVKFEKFVDDFNLQAENPELKWRSFVNFHFFSQFQPGRLDTDMDLLEQICVDSAEFPQVHGVFFLLNEQVLSAPQDIEDILQRDQKGLLELYFLTVGEPEDFIRQLERLFKELDVWKLDIEKADEVEPKERWRYILKYAMSQKVMLRWKDNPVLNVVSIREEKTFGTEFSEKLKSCFSNVNCIGIDHRGLQDIVNSNENSYRAEIECVNSLMIPGGGEKLGNAFVACISAEELVKLMTTSDGLLRRNMFDDNVRDFQGFSAVNQEMLATLKEHPNRFVLFNNGITIVCKNLKPVNGKYELENPQIVNGCQTCNMIYQASRAHVELSKVQVIAKIVDSDNDDVTQGIVRGANRQNIVYEEAFETIRSFHKDLERYFESNQVKGYQKIYYERRSRQYAANLQIKPQQKISFRGLIQSMTALFLNHVEDSHKHEYTLLKSYRDSLFIDSHSVQPYYLAAFLYLNVDILFREKKLPKELNNYKMHILLLVKEMLGGASPDLSSKEIEAYCNRLLEALEGGRLERCAVAACEKFEEVRSKWIALKGENYKYGIKDSMEFRNFLMKEIRGVADKNDAEKLYTGYVMNISLDRNNTLYGFIEHSPSNIFFHEFDNPDISRTYVGKKVSYSIVRNGSQERAVNVRLIE